ncbi:MAG: bidirectional hydrogenase complex protein HoxU [Nitrososphaerota archaeon]|nr:bidirectional hydrogenase complex protein HoxU [Candidatus Bathyarchaeota archaeon]MDW8048062.1 bidirectional hydrogenase complex protein HoxU [Nitrososphaerota archaeon]
MSEVTIKLKIDGKEVTALNGETILEAAKKSGIEIPTLCHLEGLSAFGGCRLCIVEIKGSTKLFAACTTPVAPGMEVITESPKLREYRKMIVELLLSESAHACAVCVANGNCELQELAQKLGVDHLRFNRRWTGYRVDSSHSRLLLDPNRCILCTRCIRVCDEIEGVHALDLKMRGKDSQVIVDLDDPWGSSESCTSCAKCAKVCPVGAIYIKGEPVSTTRAKNIPSFILERRKR